MREFLYLLFFLLALYGLFDLISTAIVWRNSRLLRKAALRLIQRADHLEYRG